MLNVTGHQEDSTQNRSGTTSHSWDGCYQTNRDHHVLARTWRPWDLWAPWEEAEHAALTPWTTAWRFLKDWTELAEDPAMPLLGALSGTESRDQKSSLYNWVHSR